MDYKTIFHKKKYLDEKQWFYRVAITRKILKRQFSPAGYQRWHGMKDDVETWEALCIL